MAAKKKSASRRSTAKTKGKKAAKRPAAKKKAARKSPVKVKTAARKPPAKVKKAAPRFARASVSPAVAEIDRRIALVRNNLRDLMEQATGTSGSATEDLLSDRIASQEAELKRLAAERDTLAKSGG